MSYKGVVVVAVLSIIVVITFIVIGMYYKSKNNQCESGESPYCLTITCPSDPSTSVCGGYAKRDAEKEGYVYCSAAPLTMVEDF